MKFSVNLLFLVPFINLSFPISWFDWGILKSLTHLHVSFASFLWDIGKQHSPRCDAAEHGVPSGAILFA